MPYDDHIASAWDHEYTNRTINSGEVELHVTDWNASAEGTPLLMLHGLNVQLHTWDPIAKELASDRRVVLLDLRGHGDSAWAPEYHLGSFANDIDEIVKQLELSQVALMRPTSIFVPPTQIGATSSSSCMRGINSNRIGPVD